MCCEHCDIIASTAHNGKYDLIVIDPPWENRSAIRGKKYAWLPVERMIDISLPRLAAKGAIVAIWVTNKRKFATFIYQTLFPQWDVRYLTEWHWLKVTTGGDLIHEMDSVHKKPYEVVVIGQYMEDMTTPLTSGSDSPPSPKRFCVATGSTTSSTSPDMKCFCASRDSHIGSTGETSCAMKDTSHGCICGGGTKVHVNHLNVSSPLCRPFVFVCVASQTHSQKPYLGGLLSKYFKKTGHKLELFARNLVPGWTSWGNEVLKFQEQVKPTIERSFKDRCVTVDEMNISLPSVDIL
jgi:N6-adenosine-specific RNA methylase IME4